MQHQLYLDMYPSNVPGQLHAHVRFHYGYEKMTKRTDAVVVPIPGNPNGDCIVLDFYDGKLFGLSTNNASSTLFPDMLQR